MKNGFIHVCFIIDESGSMYGSVEDVCGGFNSVINEQKQLSNGSCAVSLYRFNDNVTKSFIGKDVNEVAEMTSGYVTKNIFDNVISSVSTFMRNAVSSDTNTLTYCPNGSTAMNDGIGTAINDIGKWLSNMDESERPEKNLIVIMTDGGENASKEYTIDKVKEMIKHQAEKYNWSFMYMGTDVTDSTYANNIMGGVRGCTSSFSSRTNYKQNYEVVNNLSSTWRNMDENTSYELKNATLNCCAFAAADEITKDYETSIGIKINH